MQQSSCKDQAVRTITLTTGLEIWPLPLLQLGNNLLSCNDLQRDVPGPATELQLASQWVRFPVAGHPT